MKTYKANTVADGFIFLEAPKWHDGKVWMTDVMGKAVYSVTEDGTTEKVCDVPGMPAGIGFLSDGSLIIASLADRKLLKWKDGALSDFRDLSALPGPPNDFAIDAQDRIYLGNFGCDFHGGEALRPTALVRLDPDGLITEVAQEMEFPNGAVIINDGRTLVVNETWAGRITAFDLAEDGTLSNRRIYANLGDHQPDGMCADAEDAIWVGSYNTGHFLRVLDGGEITDRIQFDGGGVSCVIGGADGHTLFMTAYIGEEAAIAEGKRQAGLFSAKVGVGAPRAS
jgi:sugar lactone lactonase YvrE